jgi:hypothetical protein
MIKKIAITMLIIIFFSLLLISSFMFKKEIYLNYLPYAPSNHQQLLIKEFLCPVEQSDSNYSSIIGTLNFIHEYKIDIRGLIKTGCFTKLMKPESQGGYREPISAMAQSEFMRQTLSKSTAIFVQYIEENCANKAIISGLTHRISFIYQENDQKNNPAINKLLSSCYSPYQDTKDKDTQ